jgi:hypothetical protein
VTIDSVRGRFLIAISTIGAGEDSKPNHQSSELSLTYSPTNSLLHIMTSTPSYYQPKSHLSIRTDHGDLSLEVIHVFKPCTFSQGLLVRTDHAAPSLHLPAAFLLILKVYDPRFTLKERTKSPLHPELPWTFEAEAEAARIRQPLPWYDEGGYPEAPEYDLEDATRWEVYLHQCAETNFRDEFRAYQRLLCCRELVYLDVLELGDLSLQMQMRLGAPPERSTLGLSSSSTSPIPKTSLKSIANPSLPLSSNPF